MTAVIIAAVSCLLMIILVLRKPSVMIGRIQISIYWLAPLAGAAAMLLAGIVTMPQLLSRLFSNSAVNPFRILVLFFSLALMSIFLDGTGFFRWLASAALKKAGTSQVRLFLILYGVVSLLTIFTSNDIVVLTFTPFICWFAAHAAIDPMPYLICEFVAANTWSAALEIGNPTNIYLAGSAGADFADYLRIMLLPSAAAGAASLLVLFLLFRKKLLQTIAHVEVERVETDRPLLILGVACLGTCILLMALSSWLGFDMWLVSLFSMLTMVAAAVLLLVTRGRRLTPVLRIFASAPWQVIPFILSMFTIVLGLDSSGITTRLAAFLAGAGSPVWTYGAASLAASNIVNNIPMSILFSSVLRSAPAADITGALYASVLGSNLGAYITPIGALAGIMWMELLNAYGQKISFLSFIRRCAPVALAAAAAGFAALAAQGL